jgi:hypothetical protein
MPQLCYDSLYLPKLLLMHYNRSVCH